MKKPRSTGKGQISLEAGIVMLFFLIVLVSIWLGGPIQQSVEKSADTNDLLLAEQFLDAMDSAVEKSGMMGVADRRDFVVHIPFNTVDVSYGSGSGTIGPHLNISVLLYNNLTLSGGQGFSRYSVTSEGYPIWYDPSDVLPGADPPNTPFFYKTLTKELKYPLGYMPFCAHKDDSTVLRGSGTQLRDVLGNPIKFCAESGFNLHAYTLRDLSNFSNLWIFPRNYWSLPEDWIITI